MKDLFLALTANTIPFGHEAELEHLLPKNFICDEFGNYRYEIGESDTLFVAHLDTFSKKKQPVNHVIDGDYIATDETTILGADNKAGVCILINMINKQVPGVYYFFVGEEPILSGGCWGSKMALNANPEYFKRFKRAIAFDRKEYGSIVTRQMAQECCSSAFVNGLIKAFEPFLEMNPDPTGYYTDSATFLGVIPEITNLSVGVFGEHTNKEVVNWAYVQKMMDATVAINWETLPVGQEKSGRTVELIDITGIDASKEEIMLTSECFRLTCQFLGFLEFLCINRKDFTPGQPMLFSRWHEDNELLLTFSGGKVHIQGHGFTLDEFMNCLVPGHPFIIFEGKLLIGGGEVQVED